MDILKNFVSDVLNIVNKTECPRSQPRLLWGYG